MKRILCPLDFSNAANNALEYAAHTARYMGADLVLLQIVEAPTLSDIANINAGFAPAIEQRMKAAKSKLKSYCKLVEEEFSISCKQIVKSYISNIDDALKQEIRKGNYDLIIMGTKGADDFWQFYFGSHTYHVVRSISCPVLMVPQGCRFEQLNKIVYATDYRDKDVLAINKLLEFAFGFEPELTLLHINTERDIISTEEFTLFKDRFEEKLDKFKINFEQITAKKVSTGIDLYMKQNDSDALVLLTKQYDLIDQIFHHSITKELSYYASYPVLIYHA